MQSSVLPSFNFSYRFSFIEDLYKKYLFSLSLTGCSQKSDNGSLTVFFLNHDTLLHIVLILSTDYERKFRTSERT